MYIDTKNSIENHLIPKTITAHLKTNFYILKIHQTGHGMDANGCAEFCSKYRDVIFNNSVVDHKDIWKKCEGADVIVTPSWWGVARGEHFKSFTKTLAIMNQCYVVASDSMNDDCSKMSAIINPQGEVLYNGNKPCLELEYNQKEIALMRRYMDVGIG